MSDLEYQIRNWLYYTWLSGDHICEQHVHNLDVMNWAMDAHPVALRRHGRPPGPHRADLRQHLRPLRRRVRVPRRDLTSSQCRQIDGCDNNVSETIVGTKGIVHLSPGNYRSKAVAQAAGSGSSDERNPYEQEHIDLIDSIRSGKPLNELKTVAESTLTAIMGRMSAYTGKAVTWEQALNSKLDLIPKYARLRPAARPRPSPSPARPR